jgi:hypothetical protein
MQPTPQGVLKRLAGPFHNVTYYAPEIRDFAAVGVTGWWRAYFAYRSAPLGRVPLEVVVAAFYNFAPRMVARAIPSVWEVVTPERALEIRLDAVDRALRRILGEQVASARMSGAAGVARHAVEGCAIAARPLFAAHSALPWPDEPHLCLWHACTLLREQRGDAHAIALASAGVDGPQSHVLMAALGHGNRASILAIRGWTTDEWHDAEARLAERGWLDGDGVLTEQGRDGRRAIEAQTDELCREPTDRLGPDGLAALADKLGPLVDLLLDSGEVPATWPPPHLLRPA